MPHKVLVVDDANGDGETTRRIVALVDRSAEVVVVHDIAAAQAELCGSSGALYTHIVVDLYFDQPEQKNGIDFVSWLLEEQERPPDDQSIPLHNMDVKVFAWSWSPEYVATMEGIVDRHGEIGWRLVTVKAYAGDSTATRDMLKEFLRRPRSRAAAAGSEIR